MSEIQQAAGIGELFDTLLVFENYPVDREGLAAPAGGLRLGAVEGRDATHYPLALLVQPGEVLRLRLDHRPDLISRGEAELIGARLIRLLTAAAADAARPLGALPILDDAERDTLLRLWNDTAQPGSAGDLARAVRAAGSAHAGRHRRDVRGPHARAMPRSTPMPTAWRITCAGLALAPTSWSGSASSARRRC